MLGSRRSWMLVGALFFALPFGGCNCGQRHEGLAGESGIPQGPPRLDFGNVAVGQSIRLPVWLSNAGTAPLDLLSQSTSGPPFSEPTPFAATSLLPGGKGNAVVAFSPTAPGPFSGTLTIDGDGEPTALVIPMTGVGFDIAVTASPMSLSFGQVPVGISPAPTQTVTFANAGSAGVYLSFGMSSLAPEYTVADAQGTSMAGANVLLAAGASLALTVAFAPDAVSIFNSAFTFTACADQTTQSCLASQSISLSGQGVAGQLSISPNPIVFGSVPVGSTSTQTITVTNVGSAAASVSCLYLQSLGASACGSASSFFSFGTPSVALPATLAAGGSLTLPLSYLSSGSTADTDVLAAAYTTQGLGTPSVATDNIQASQSAAPCALSLSPSSLSFSYAGAGTPVSESLTLTNTGGTACQVSGIALNASSDPGYALAAGQALSLTLAPGANAPIGVTFELATAGPPNLRTGELDFATTDSLHPNVKVPLSATTATAYAGGGAWPRWHHDNVQSGRSPVDTSGLAGVVAWTVSVGAPGPSYWGGSVNDYLNSPVVGTDGTVYQLGMDGTLYAVNPDGGLQWKTFLEGPINDPHPGTPIIAADNTLYVAFGDTLQVSLTYGMYRVSSAGAILTALPPLDSGDGFDLPPILTNAGLLLGEDDFTGSFAFQIGDGGIDQVAAGPVTLVADQASAVVGPDDTTYWCGGSSCQASASPANGLTQLPWSIPTANIAFSETSDLALDVDVTGHLFILFAGWYVTGSSSQQLVAVDPRRPRSSGSTTCRLPAWRSRSRTTSGWRTPPSATAAPPTAPTGPSTSANSTGSTRSMASPASSNQASPS